MASGFDKYGEASSNSASTNTNNKGDKNGVEEVLSKEEKLRRRQEKIRLWKLKKDQEDEEERKKLERQQKLEEWKRKKELKNKISSDVEQKGSISLSGVNGNGSNTVVNSIIPSLKIRPISKKNGGAKPSGKRSIFDADDDDVSEGSTKKKVPKFIDENVDYRRNETNESEDELETFFKTLEDEEKAGYQQKGIDNVVLEDTGVDDEDVNDDVNELEAAEESENKLLASRIEKLQQKEKLLQTVDHENINYKAFRRVFYTESSELSKLSEEEVDTIRLLLDGIKVRGVDCPRPILKWSQLGLPSTMMDIIEDKLEYDAPSSIQSQALPAILSGRDVIGVAKTGSGKTLSFVLPMIRHIQGQEQNDDIGRGPIAVIMSPTRELSLQIYKEITNFTKKNDISVSCCYGGAPIQNQIADLKRGVDIIVGTPGRIIDLLSANSGRVTNFNRVSYLVLDEADRMFDMGFEPQVMRVFGQVRPDRQTVLFSATFPRMMELIAKKLLHRPIEIIVGGRSIVAPEIKQKVELIKLENESELETVKFNKLIQVLKNFNEKDPEGKILIFVEKQTSADELLVELLKQNYACLAIHGGKDQMDRKYSIKEFASFKSGINILIATSIAARGLDVKGLNLVVNYDSPNHMEDYVHRVGRTGRAGMPGTAITFVSSTQERAITDLVKAMRLSKTPESEISPELVEISDNFLKKVKSGKEKFGFGFGGKGLDKLQEIRDNKQELERKQYVKEDSPEIVGNNGKKSGTGDERKQVTGAGISGSGTNVTSSKIEFPQFEIIEGRAPETAGPDISKFHARIAVNDLPQTARWNIVSRDSLSKIIEATGTSITNKGQFYPSGTLPKPTIKNGREIAPPPKLYLLVEGLTESAVKEAISLLRQKMVEGLETAVKEENRGGPATKYDV